MNAVVVDASVLAAVVFGEPEAEKALACLDDTTQFAPTLLTYEMAQVAVTKCLRTPEQTDAILQCFSWFLSLEIELSEPDAEEVTNLALQTGLSAYDASYLSLSRHLGAPLVTFDEKLQKYASA